MTTSRNLWLLLSASLAAAPITALAQLGNGPQTGVKNIRASASANVSGSGVSRTTANVLGYNVDQYTWTDSAGRPRTVSLKQEGNGNSGHGGYAVQMTYQVLESGVTRTVTVNINNSAGDGGFGYFVAHELYRSFDDGSYGTIAELHGDDDSPLGLGFPVTTSSSTIYANTTTATETFHTTYPKWGTITPISDPTVDQSTPVDLTKHQLFQVPVTIVWTFQSGTDFPRIDYTVDISASTQGQLAFDMRGPYGVLEFADSNTGATINNVQWGDSAYHFNSNVSTTGFLQQSTSWNWNSPIGSSRPYHAMIAKHSTTGVLYETGLFEIKLGSDTGLAYSVYADHRGTSGSGFYQAAGGIDQGEWPFQSAQYSGGAGDGGWLAGQSMTGKKFAWGTAPFYGTGLSTVFLNSTKTTPIHPYPNGGVITYRTCWVVGKSTYSGVGTASLTRGIAASSTPSCAIGQPDGSGTTPPPVAGYVPLVPTRVLDTRPGQTTTDGTFAGAGPLAASASLDLTLIGRGGVPSSGVSAVVLNVTATDPISNGFVTVWPTGSTRPLASNLNFTPGQTIPNLVVAKLGSAGKVSLFNSSGSTNLIADVAGYFVSTSDLTAITPVRLLDTRSGQTTIDGSFAGAGAIPASGELDLTVLNRGGIPASGVTAVVLNVTATNPSADGYMTVWPTGSSTPFASNLNFTAGETIANLVTAKVGSNGKISFYNNAGSTDVIADAVGYFSGTTDLTALVPSRILDTRVGQLTSDGQFEGGGALASGTTFNFTVLGRGGVPATGVGAVVLNVTATNPTAASYLTVWPSGSTRPLASNLNYVPGETIPNLVIAKVGTSGQVSLYNGIGSTDVVADVVGWFSGTP